MAARPAPGGPPGAVEDRLSGRGNRIVPGDPPRHEGDDESAHVWGFRDSAFAILPNGNVVFSGSRYPLCGAEMPDLLPWTRNILAADLRPDDTHDVGTPPEVPAPREHPAFLAAVRAILPADAVRGDPAIRLRHGHGHTLEEMYAIKYDGLERVPDLVVYPGREEEVVALVEAAIRHDVCLVPYGGGTNVSDALRCPPQEDRIIVAVDMSRMNRILWIDPTNLMACIEAGAVGRHIHEQLAAHGFTLGHEPDSVEFSTLGGWIATRCSGMKKNRYGNIEDLVLDVHAVTAGGELSRTDVAPRESIGVDPVRLLLGSEGTLGIITRAVVKIFPLPAVQRYDSLLFPSFRDGVAFMYELTRGGVTPASVRLVDNLQFQLSLTLKPKAVGLTALKRRAERFVVTKLRGFEPERMVACTLVYEGGEQEVAAQERAVKRIARRHGGMRAGAANGRVGYQLTFGIAYLRDFVMKHYVLGESLETSVAWSRVLDLCDGVKRRVAEEYARRNLPGKPFLSCRVTQVYQTGVCVYFYLAFYHKGVERPSEVFKELEQCARDEILARGGSLSHHHGIGKLRRAFLPRVMSPTALAWSGEVKRAVDPSNVFGIANQGMEGNRPVSTEA